MACWETNEVYQAFDADWKKNKHSNSSKSPYADIAPTYGYTTTARLLFAFCELNLVPDNQHVRKDFGFDLIADAKPSTSSSSTKKSTNSIKSPEAMLLGVFNDLRRMGVGHEDVHRWRTEGEGRLVEEIKETFTEYGPEEVRGEFFPWFTDNWRSAFPESD